MTDLRAGAAGPGIPSVDDILVSIGEVPYRWSLSDDRLDWGGNAASVLGLASGGEIATGRAFARFLAPENLATRYDAVVESGQIDPGDGVPYQVQYRFLPDGVTVLWIEDTGRWFAGSDGRPAFAQGVLRVVNDRHEREEQLAYLSRYDALTGLMNRSALSDCLAGDLADARKSRGSVGFMLAAVDNLAMINDAYGFDVADEVIAAVASRLKSRLRACDVLGRVSGNKFGIMLRNCSEADMMIAADRLLRGVRDDIVQTEHGPIAATVSIGGVIGPRYAQDEGQAMLHAHEGLAEAKARGPGSFVAFHHIRERSDERKSNIRLAAEIVDGLNEGRFSFAYQPIVDARTGVATMQECLIRLARTDGSQMVAGMFIPVVEKLGLVRLLDHRVLEMALADLRAHPDLTLSINISGASAASPEWLAFLFAAVRDKPDLASRLVVELTETMAIQNLGETSRFVGALRDLGCRVAIDDFGAGYTSFKTLRLLKVDIVKIDGAYVENLSKSRDDQIFVRAMVDLARNFGLITVAEWVRDAESAEILRGFGVDYLQGALCGMPSAAHPGTRRDEPRRSAG